MANSSGIKKVNKAARTGGGPHKRMQTPPLLLLALFAIVAVGSATVWASRSESIVDALPRAGIDNYSAAYGFYLCDAVSKTDTPSGDAAAGPEATTTTTTSTTTTTTTVPVDPTVSSTVPQIVEPVDPLKDSRAPGFIQNLQNPNGNASSAATGFYTKNKVQPDGDNSFLPVGDGVIYISPQVQDDNTNPRDVSGRQATLGVFLDTQSVSLNKTSLNLLSAKVADGDPMTPDKVWKNDDACPTGKGEISVWSAVVSKDFSTEVLKAFADHNTALAQINASGDGDDVKATNSAEEDSKFRAVQDGLRARIGELKLTKTATEPRKVRLRDRQILVLAFLPKGETPPVPVDNVLTMLSAPPTPATAASSASATPKQVDSLPQDVSGLVTVPAVTVPVATTVAGG